MKGPSMTIIPTDSPEFEAIERTLSEDPDSTVIEMIGGIECDEEDLAHQREEGVEDPAASIDLIAQIHTASKTGMLDWFQIRVSSSELDPPNIEHGGTLLAFTFEGDEPDFDALAEAAIPALNEAVSWAEFSLDEDDEDEEEEDEQDAK